MDSILDVKIADRAEVATVPSTWLNKYLHHYWLSYTLSWVQKRRCKSAVPKAQRGFELKSAARFWTQKRSGVLIQKRSFKSAARFWTFKSAVTKAQRAFEPKAQRGFVQQSSHVVFSHFLWTSHSFKQSLQQTTHHCSVTQQLLATQG